MARHHAQMIRPKQETIIGVRTTSIVLQKIASQQMSECHQLDNFLIPLCLAAFRADNTNVKTHGA